MQKRENLLHDIECERMVMAFKKLKQMLKDGTFPMKYDSTDSKNPYM